MEGRRGNKGILFLLLLLLFSSRVRSEEVGSIIGTIQPPQRCQWVVARTRFTSPLTGGKDYPGVIDPETGVFKISNLPTGIYDLTIGVEGYRIEGVNMRINGEEGEPGEQIKEILRKKVNSYQEFFNKKEIILFRGKDSKVSLLVSLLRDKPTTLPSPQKWLIKRIEVWIMEEVDEEMWWRTRTRFIMRKKVEVGREKRERYVFEPALGGVEVFAPQDKNIGTYTLPSSEELQRRCLEW